MSWRFALPALALLILVAPSNSRAQEDEEEGGPPYKIGAGKSPFKFDSLDKNQKTYTMVGHNSTGQQIKDFELELKGCGPAKFKRVKVYPKVVFDDKGDSKELDQTSDWDVDDDGSGLSDQQFVPDPAAKDTKPPGRTNETDNVDDTPDTKTRVDANGSSGGSAERNAQPEHDARRAKTEDPNETKPGDPAGKGPPKQPDEPLDGEGGIQPGDHFILEFDLTDDPKGDECVFVLVPSGVGGRQIALLDEGAKPGLAPGQEYAAATPDSSPSRAFTGFEVAFTPGGTFGSIKTQQENTFDGKSNGKNIHYEAANLHLDLRGYYGGRGPKSWFRPSLIFGLKGAGTLGGAERGLKADNHPPFGTGSDSFVDYEINGTLTPFLGLTLVDLDCSRINVLAGPRITFAEITGITDESGGGGELERFRNKVVQVGPAVGVELDVPLPFLRHDNFEAGVRVAGWGEYLPGTDVSGHSSTFPFDYEFETKGAFLGTVRGGFYARFGGFDF